MADITGMLGKNKKRKGPRSTMADDKDYNDSYNKWLDEHEKFGGDKDTDSEEFINYEMGLKQRRDELNKVKPNRPSSEIGEQDAAFSFLEAAEKKRRLKKLNTQ